MADPTKFTPSYDFSDYQAQAPASPLPGAQVDIQFQALKTTTDQAIEAIKDVRRSDGALKNGIVTADSLASSLVIGFTLRGDWVVGTDYMAGDGMVYGDIFYKSRIAHTSTSLNRPDLDPGTWEFLTSMAAISVTDGSITPAKLSSDAEGFRTKIGAASVAQADFAANTRGAVAKSAFDDADELGFWDSVSEGLRKITWANVKATFTAMFVRFDIAQALSQAQQLVARLNIGAAAKIDTTPNLFVNGSLTADQQNVYALGTTNGYFAADQWGMYINASGAAVTVQNVELANDDGGDRAIELKVTTAKASLGASDAWTLTQNIEGFRPQFKAARFGTAGAKPFVLRFDIVAPAAGTYSWHFQNQNGTRHCWVPFTVTSGQAGNMLYIGRGLPGDPPALVVPPCTDGTWLKGEGQTGLICDLVLAAGATLVGGTASTWGATAYYAGAGQKNCLDALNTIKAAEFGLKLDPDATGVYGAYEIGEVDAVFRAERYYGPINIGTGVASGTLTINAPATHSKRCKVVNALSVAVAVTMSDGFATNPTQSSAAVALSTGGLQSSTVALPNFTGLTSGRPYYWNPSSGPVFANTRLS